MAYDERELLARLIQCEAGGEGEVGMKAVAGVVMNRVNVIGGEKARLCNGDLFNVVFQPGQFTCLAEYTAGVYNPQNIYNMRPTQENYYIADWALAGNRLPIVGDALWCYSPYDKPCKSYFPSRVGQFTEKIGRHCFYVPTDAYYET